MKSVKKAGKDLGIKIKATHRGGASDGNQIAKFKVGVLDGFGVIGSGGHTEKEKILLPSIKNSAACDTDYCKCVSRISLSS